MKRNESVAVIADTVALGEALEKIVAGEGKNSRLCVRFSWLECPTVLTRARLVETDLFVIDLFRSYRDGLRAEGITLAQRLAMRGKSFLIVSPLSVSTRLQCAGYWDVEAENAIADRIQELLQGEWRSTDGFQRVIRHFANFLAVPSQHDDVAE